jgi:hypothetical protein
MPLSIPSEPWERVHKLHNTSPQIEWDGCHSVVVDQFSKLAKMAPTKTITTTFDSTKSLFDMWVRHHVMPQFIISDRDVKFMTSF